MKSLVCAASGMVLLSIACSSTERPPNEQPVSSAATGGATSSSSVGGGGATGPMPTRATLEGEVTWTVTFDETAKAAGATDCTYTRHYQGVEDESAPWLCPACEVMFRAEVQITAGLDDCYTQVSESAPAPVEWIGWGDGVYYRGVGGPMSEQGSATTADTAVTTANMVTMQPALLGGTLTFDVAGQLTLGEEDGDPMHGFATPSSYACGWPTSDAPPYDGNYQLAVGQTVPDGLFKDSCDQTVRLHDFAGDYLLIDMAALDCPPCQMMASEEEQFVSEMAVQGITVHVITLMAPSLANPVGETTTAMLEGWTQQYALASPVLADRGWGLSMFVPLFAEETGYPSWVLVAPDLTVMQHGTGYGGFTDFQNAIVAHDNP